MVKGMGKKPAEFGTRKAHVFVSLFFSMEFIGNFRVAVVSCQGQKMPSLFASEDPLFWAPEMI